VLGIRPNEESFSRYENLIREQLENMGLGAVLEEGNVLYDIYWCAVNHFEEGSEFLEYIKRKYEENEKIYLANGEKPIIEQYLKDWKKHKNSPGVIGEISYRQVTAPRKSFRNGVLERDTIIYEFRGNYDLELALQRYYSRVLEPYYRGSDEAESRLRDFHIRLKSME